MVQKKVKKAMKKKKKKKKHTDELRAFEKMSVSDSDQKSSDSSSSKEGKIWKIGPGELFNLNNNCSRKKLKQYKESFFNLDDCIDASYNYKNNDKILNLLHRKI